jgi:hypothetical protein
VYVREGSGWFRFSVPKRIFLRVLIHQVNPETRAAKVARSSSLAMVVLVSAKTSASLPLGPSVVVIAQE